MSITLATRAKVKTSTCQPTSLTIKGLAILVPGSRAGTLDLNTEHFDARGNRYNIQFYSSSALCSTQLVYTDNIVILQVLNKVQVYDHKWPLYSYPGQSKSAQVNDRTSEGIVTIIPSNSKPIE